MLTLIFDPILGDATPDGLAQKTVELLLAEGRASDIERTTSTGLVIEHLRLKMAQGDVTPDDVVVLYQGARMCFDAKGKLPQWPKGFCTQHSAVLQSLVRGSLRGSSNG